MKQLGDILLEGGLVTHDQLAVAIDEQNRLGRSLGRVLVDQGVLTEAQLVASLAAQIGMRFVDLGDIQIDGSALGRVPGHVARRHTAIPIGYEEGKLVVAMADPANVFAIDDIRSLPAAARLALQCIAVGAVIAALLVVVSHTFPLAGQAPLDGPASSWSIPGSSANS